MSVLVFVVAMAVIYMFYNTLAYVENELIAVKKALLKTVRHSFWTVMNSGVDVVW